MKKMHLISISESFNSYKQDRVLNAILNQFLQNATEICVRAYLTFPDTNIVP